MLSTFLTALAFAIGHHAFYQSLNDSPVLNSAPFSLTTSYDVSDQQFNVSVGTLFAFFVKALLKIAVSTVFDQFEWKSVRGRTTRIGIIDSGFSRTTIEDPLHTNNLTWDSGKGRGVGVKGLLWNARWHTRLRWERRLDHGSQDFQNSILCANSWCSRSITCSFSQ